MPDSNLPPLPDGFTLDSAAPQMPPLPEGFSLDQPSSGPAQRPPLSSLDPSEYDPNSPGYQAKYGATSGMSAINKLLAGAGKAFVDLGRGAMQTVGLESRQDVANSRALDAPLMQSGWAKAGNVAGNIAATLPALAIPGAATVPGAAAVGGALGFLQPSTSTKETALNTGLGAAASAAGQYVGNKVAGYMGQKLADRSAAAAEEESLNSVRDAVLQRSRDAGYKVAPTSVNPSMTNTALESIAGKAATRQGAEAINAKVTNRLISEDLGLAADQPITKSALQAVRDKAGQIYQAVKGAGTIAADQEYSDAITKLANAGTDLESAFPGIGAQANEKVKELVTSLAQPQFDSSQAVGAFRFLNQRAKAGFQAAFSKGGDPQILELARAQKGAADAIGELIQRNLASSGNEALANAWQTARTTIAKTYTAEAALKGGNVSAVNLARQLQKGVPLTGGFKTAAEFGDMFADVARLPKSGVGVSKLGASLATAEGGGALAALATGHPIVAGSLAAGSVAQTALPWAARRALLSGVGQGVLATPNYAPNMLGTVGREALQGLGRYGALPAVAAGVPFIQSDQEYPPNKRVANP